VYQPRALVSKFTRKPLLFCFASERHRAATKAWALIQMQTIRPRTDSSARGWNLVCCSVYRAAGDGSFACTPPPPPMIASGEAKKCVAKYAGGVRGERERLVCPLECVDPPRCLRLLPGRAALGRFINHVVAKTLEHGSQRAHTHTNNNVAIFQRRPCTSRACCSHSREIGSGKPFFLLETHPGDLVGTLQFYQDKNMLNIEIWIFLALW